MKRLFQRPLLFLGLVAASWPVTAFAAAGEYATRFAQSPGQFSGFIGPVPSNVDFSAVAATLVFVVPMGRSPSPILIYWIDFGIEPLEGESGFVDR